MVQGVVVQMMTETGFPLKRWKKVPNIRDHLKFHIDRWRSMILIFHLSLSQGRLAGRTPMDRFLSLVDRTVQKKLSKFPDNRCLVVKIHGEVGILPFTKDAKTFEFFPLDIHKFGCVIPASLPNLHDGEFSLLRTETLLDLVFHGQPMTVPSRNIGAIKSGHELRFHDEVFQNFIQGRSDMNVSIRIGRTIVKNVFGPPFCLFDSIDGKSSFLPLFSISGSLFARLAFMGKSVLGRLSVWR